MYIISRRFTYAQCILSIKYSKSLWYYGTSVDNNFDEVQHNINTFDILKIQTLQYQFEQKLCFKKKIIIASGRFKIMNS